MRLGGEVRRLADAESVAVEGAQEFVRTAEATLRERSRFNVVLAGGSTPRRMLELLAESSLRERIDWSRIGFFFGDERTVAPDHADSNFAMASEALLSKLELSPGQVRRIEGEDADPDASARRYEGSLLELLDSNTPGEAASSPSPAPPRFDLVYLGIGEDGHTASLFPGTAALTERSRWVVANAVPALGTTRITLTYPVFAAARRVVFMACGSAKAGPIAEILLSKTRAAQLPAAQINPTRGQLVWLLDEEAAARLG